MFNRQGVASNLVFFFLAASVYVYNTLQTEPAEECFPSSRSIKCISKPCLLSYVHTSAVYDAGTVVDIAKHKHVMYISMFVQAL